ncbi:hypothetical protein STEG23_014535, partial [Scotinomys teguina]
VSMKEWMETECIEIGRDWLQLHLSHDMGTRGLDAFHSISCSIAAAGTCRKYDIEKLGPEAYRSIEAAVTVQRLPPSACHVEEGDGADSKCGGKHCFDSMTGRLFPDTKEQVARLQSRFDPGFLPVLSFCNGNIYSMSIYVRVSPGCGADGLDLVPMLENKMPSKRISSGSVVLKKLKPLKPLVTLSSPETKKAVGEEESPKGGSPKTLGLSLRPANESLLQAARQMDTGGSRKSRTYRKKGREKEKKKKGRKKEKEKKKEKKGRKKEKEKKKKGRKKEKEKEKEERKGEREKEKRKEKEKKKKKGRKERRKKRRK